MTLSVATETEGTCAPNTDGLRAGDVLLLLGGDQIARLIAWCGDSIYSHAALVVSDCELIEATAAGVAIGSLDARLHHDGRFLLIDAYRPCGVDGIALSEADRDLIVVQARSLLGTPYPIDALATLGVLVAIRGKWPQHWLARLVVREALDHLVRNDPSHVVCSEMVYRAFAECAALPPGRLAPRIVLSAPTHLAFPEIDWKALWDEVWTLLHPARQQVLGEVAMRLSAVDGAPAGVVAAALTDVGDAELAERSGVVRATLGLPPISDRVDDAGALLVEAGHEAPLTVLAQPNPKLVTPLDLAATPSHAVLGRLKTPPA